MCRFAILATDDEHYTKMRILDRLMLMNAADGTQQDGWGVTNGDWLFKTAGSYHNTLAPALDELFTVNAKPSNVLVGHVRKSSFRTSADDPRGAHPFEYEVNGEKLFIAHNGYVAGKSFVWNTDNVTDTQRFAPILVDLVAKYNDLNTEIIQEWLAHTYQSSAFVFVIMFRGITHIVTDAHDHRSIYYIETENGPIFGTSARVLQSLAVWMHNSLGITTIVHEEKHSGVYKVNKNSHLWFSIESEGFKAWHQTLKYEQSKEPVTVYSYRRNVPAYSQTSRYEELRTKLNTVINPMRTDLLGLWASDLLSFNGGNNRPYPKSLFSRSTEEELGALLETAIRIFTQGDEEAQKKRRRLLGTWNDIIPGNFRKDAELHVHMFGKDYFWLYSDLIDEKRFKEHLKSNLDLYADYIDAMSLDHITYKDNGACYLGELELSIFPVIEESMLARLKES